ncbi:hypothetical protein FBU59_001762 [Linderina macrospora]|uniref:Uncharacterized protein n=1 Tax=Linderina macrospora TaxID=4868 RepID=A0ACC1JD99_9FUNG|nr:hypothetical protein FBU59_001762 [Linderina macrospora]
MSSAQISYPFTYQIIWNMNANMFKDSDTTVMLPETSSAISSIEEIVDGNHLLPIEDSNLLDYQLSIGEDTMDVVHDALVTPKAVRLHDC